MEGKSGTKTIEVVLPPSISGKPGDTVLPVEIDSSSPADLFRRFIELYPEPAAELFEAGGDPLPQLLVSLGDKIIRREEWPETVLEDGDRLYLFLALSGG